VSGRKLAWAIEVGCEAYQRAKCPRGFRPESFQGKDYWVRRGYYLEECLHEGGAFQDNCMRCAPLWGVVAVKAE
jgi:hypothetical protein